MSWSRRLAYAGLFYLLAVLVFFWPFFFEGKSFLPNDVYLMLYKPFSETFGPFNPFNHFEDDIMKFCYLYQWGAREFLYQPYWIPEVFGGYAPYANTYASHFSTLNWILPLGPLHITYPLKLICSLWIAGFSMFSLLSYLRLSFVPSLFGGLSYMFSSLFITMLLRWWIPGAFGWFPLIILFTWSAFKGKTRGSFGLASLFLAFSFLDGFFQTSASIVLALGVFLLVVGWQKDGARGVLRATTLGTGIFAVAFCLSAIMWVPQLEYFWWDIQKGGTRAAGNDFGKALFERILGIPMLVAAFFPQALGSVRTLDVTKFVRGHLQDFTLFIGTIPLLLGLSTWSQRKNKELAPFWVLTALGVVIPLFTFMDRFVYYRFFAVFIFGMAVLGAFGFDRGLKGGGRSSLHKVSLGGVFLTAALGSVSLLLCILTWIKAGWLEGIARKFIEARLSQTTVGSRNPQWMADRAEAFVRYWSFRDWDFVLPLLLTGLAVALLYFWVNRKIKNHQFVASAFVLTFFQLMIFARGWLPFLDLNRFPLYPENEIALFMRTHNSTNQYRTSVNDSNRASSVEKQIVPSNSSFFYSYYSLEGFDGVRPASVYDVPSTFENPTRLGELNVKYIITNPEPPLTNKNYALRHKGYVAIYENLLAKPRGRIFYSFKESTFKESRSQLAADLIPAQTVFLDGTVDIPSHASPPSNSALLIEDLRNQISYEVQTDEPGLLVTSESFYPGWRALVNDQPSKVLRANAVMRAVEVPSGKSIVKFEFKPASYRWGLGITLLSIFLFGFYFWRTSRLRRA